MQEAPKWHIGDVDAETLAEQCDRFRADIFAKAGKVDPVNNPALAQPDTHNQTIKILTR